MTETFQRRPSESDLTIIINKARGFIKSEYIEILNDSSFYEDVLELGIFTKEDFHNILHEIVDSLIPEDYVVHHPSRRSYDPKIRSIEIFEFRKNFNIEKANCKICIKFSVTYEKFLLISLRKVRKI